MCIGLYKIFCVQERYALNKQTKSYYKKTNYKQEEHSRKKY